MNNIDSSRLKKIQNSKIPKEKKKYIHIFRKISVHINDKFNDPYSYSALLVYETRQKCACS